MLRISLQRSAQFATGRIRRGGHDSVSGLTFCEMDLRRLPCNYIAA
jgi:hypothetical protein